MSDAMNTALLVYGSITGLMAIVCIGIGSEIRGFFTGKTFFAYTFFWPIALFILGIRGLKDIWED